jgi:hypothetical protein
MKYKNRKILIEIELIEWMDLIDGQYIEIICKRNDIDQDEKLSNHSKIKIIYDNSTISDLPGTDRHTAAGH